MKTVNRNQVLECDDAGLAYSTFHTVISEKYNKQSGRPPKVVTLFSEN